METETPKPSADELLRRATAALESGDIASAVATYGELRHEHPGNPAGWFGGGLAAEADGDLDSALILLSRAAELDPERAPVHLAHGRLLARLGIAGPGLTALDRARKLDPKEPNAYLFAALLLRDAGRYAEAEALLRDGIANAAPRPEFWDQLGLALLSQQKAEAALAVVDDFLTSYAPTFRIELVRGLALAEDRERRDDAIVSLEKAIAGGEGGALARIELADLLIDADRLDDAVARFAEAVEIDPSNPQAHFRLGQALQLAGRREEAASSLRRFRELRKDRDTESARAKRLGTRLNTAVEHLRENRLSEALVAVDEVLADAPGHARTLAMKAKIVFSQGDVTGALEAATAARKADPSLTEHYYLEGLFSYHLGKLPEAEASIARALAMDPDLAEGHEIAAIVAYRLERPRAAVAHFERAIALGIDHENFRRAYALALEALGNTD